MSKKNEELQKQLENQMIRTDEKLSKRVNSSSSSPPAARIPMVSAASADEFAAGSLDFGGRFLMPLHDWLSRAELMKQEYSQEFNEKLERQNAEKQQLEGKYEKIKKQLKEIEGTYNKQLSQLERDKAIAQEKLSNLEQKKQELESKQ